MSESQDVRSNVGEPRCISDVNHLQIWVLFQHVAVTMVTTLFSISDVSVQMERRCTALHLINMLKRITHTNTHTHTYTHTQTHTQIINL